MLQLTVLIIAAIWMGVGSVFGLRLEDAEEGSCRGIRYKALPHIDLDFVESLHYLSAGNRYHLYRLASDHPHFSKLRPFELYYSSCFTKNTSYSAMDETLFGFGGTLGRYTVRPRREQPSIIDTTPLTGPYDPTRIDRLQHHITLTDHRTFVFLANCWVGSDQRSWDVYSLTPDLSASAKRMIEEHALSLGFKREEIVFLNYNNCGEHPFPDAPESGQDGGGEEGEKIPGFGWKGTSLARNPIISYPGMVSFPNINMKTHSGFGGGKIVTSRATINPILGNNNLRRGNSITGSGRLSLASAGSGWSR